MNAETIAALADVNRRFYRTHAASFSASRQHPWEGWRRLGRHLPQRRALRVLDVGCGNGRFGRFLRSEQGAALDYHGIDGCGQLLAEARSRLTPHCYRLRLDRIDLVLEPARLAQAVAGERFDLVVLFGVLHHIPGTETRIQLLRQLSARVAPGGLLAASVWQPGQAARIGRKTLPWRHYHSAGRPAIDLGELDPNDLLLTWNGDRAAPRYCHLADAREVERWIDSLPLGCVDRFRRDGSGSGDNLYLVLQAAGSAAAAATDSSSRPGTP